jgi:hypothetical protein
MDNQHFQKKTPPWIMEENLNKAIRNLERQIAYNGNDKIQKKVDVKQVRFPVSISPFVLSHQSGKYLEFLPVHQFYNDLQFAELLRTSPKSNAAAIAGAGGQRHAL